MPSRDAFSSGECEFLKQLSEHVALAGHQAALYGALQQAYDDLRQSQIAVLQQERLRALGQMASGIAHDINNAISPVALYTESLLEREPNLSERTRNYLTTIQRAIDDVARTVSRMREFYRERETQLTLERVNLNRAVEQVLDLTRPRWSDLPQQRGLMIELRLQLAPDLPDIMGAENEIRDALTNVIFNAVDAMPNGGTLTLRTLATTRPDGTTAVTIEVGDTGIGMDEDTRRRCLEPFYTTKGERGTGLGLAMVYGMIQRHSADLAIDSAPDAGTTVRLTFAAFTSSVASTVRYPASQAPNRKLRILLVDDDPLLIQSLQDTLQEDGHLVTAASGGQAGIDEFRAARARGEALRHHRDGPGHAARRRTKGGGRHQDPVAVVAGDPADGLGPTAHLVQRPAAARGQGAEQAAATAGAARRFRGVRPVSPAPHRLLVVDDEAAQMRALCDTLQFEGYSVQGFTSAREALASLRPRTYDLLLTDLMMPEMDGIHLIAAARKIDVDLGAVVMTGHGTIDTAVQAMRGGASDYIIKPFKLNVILPVLARALDLRRLRLENAQLQEQERRRSEELAAAYQDLEAFAYSVSHDLRAPLRAVDGYAAHARGRLRGSPGVRGPAHAARDPRRQPSHGRDDRRPAVVLSRDTAAAEAHADRHERSRAHGRRRGAGDAFGIGASRRRR